MWLGCVFASTVHYGICILSLTRMVRLRPRQYTTAQYTHLISAHNKSCC